SVDVLLKRIIGSTGLDYYESGRDIGLSTDIYNSFEIYQKRCIEEYKKLQKEYNFININGEASKEEIHKQIRARVKEVLDLGIVK
ncbi:MAG: thymidylate kinase, partial [bacterium]|nr:thymidylate kinase [bacterium]